MQPYANSIYICFVLSSPSRLQLLVKVTYSIGLTTPTCPVMVPIPIDPDLGDAMVE
jgi:hypothetical protein